MQPVIEMICRHYTTSCSYIAIANYLLIAFWLPLVNAILSLYIVKRIQLDRSLVLGKSQLAVENNGTCRKLVAKSHVMSQLPSVVKQFQWGSTIQLHDCALLQVATYPEITLEVAMM